MDISDSLNPVDKHVGGRLRLRRMTLGMSQEELARNLGLTYQQIQKYERGSNRIGAGRLYLAACLLKVPVQYFFEGVESTSPSEDDEMSYVSTSEGLALNEAFSAISSPQIRQQLISLIAIISTEQKN